MPRRATAVRLLKKVKLGTDWGFVPVRFAKNGKIKLDGQDGTFYLDFRQDGRRKRVAVGIDPTDAITARDRQAHRLRGEVIGVRTPATAEINDKTLAAAIDDYLEEKRLSRKKSSHAVYRNSLTKFQQSCTKVRLADITRKDLVSFAAYCRDELNLSRRSVYSHFANVISFLKASGVEKLVQKGDWPQFVEEPPEIYEPEELGKFFSACTAEEKVYFNFFLMTGEREQEVMYTYWSDIKLEASVVRVTEKPEFGYAPKAYKGREIPIPQKLVEMLRPRKAKRDPKCPLLFPTSGCRPQDHFLEICKAVAKRAGLEGFYLHKFRSTFATRHLQNGVDIRTVQAWMGHDDLASTMRYLRPARGEQVRDKVNSTFA